MVELPGSARARVTAGMAHDRLGAGGVRRRLRRREAEAEAEGVRRRVHCVRSGLHELEGRGPVEAFDVDDELPGGVIACEVGAICPDETALYVPAHRALAYRRLLELDFDLLLAHGDPVLTGGKEALRTFAH